MNTKFKKKRLLPKIDNLHYQPILFESDNLPHKYPRKNVNSINPVGNVKLNPINPTKPLNPIKPTNPTNPINPINPTNPMPNIKLNSIKKNNFKKTRTDCIDAEEYLQQFYNIPEIYNINELNSKLIYLKKILLGKNIFLVKTGWESVWNETSYSIDKAEEMICKRYANVVEKRYETYDIKYNLSKYKCPKLLMYLLYTKELVSFIDVSDYSIYLGKINGFIKLNIWSVNIEDKNIILNCMRETFFDRFTYNDKTSACIIQLKKK